MTLDVNDPLSRDFRVIFLRCLGRHDELSFHDAYLLGRRAMEQSMSLLSVVELHHQILAEVLTSSTPADEIAEVAACAARFLVELLAPYEMSQRAAAELRQRSITLDG